ncbi:hypothetical protein BY996DRAFT_8691821 [Phakopsora pachyrhizi]|nr:hypothetical protein BY996DRAFT_8691821 [Phakopsora pachyrhizi]
MYQFRSEPDLLRLLNNRRNNKYRDGLRDEINHQPISLTLPLSPTTRPRPTPKPKSTSTTKPTTIRPQTPDLTNSRPESPSQINLANLVENWGVGGLFICIHFQTWQSLAEIIVYSLKIKASLTVHPSNSKTITSI